MNLGHRCHSVLLEDDSSVSCQEQWNQCEGKTTEAALTTLQITEELGLQTSTPLGSNTACDECLENNIALEDDPCDFLQSLKYY